MTAITLAALLFLQQVPSYSCAVDDVPCWRRAALDQEDRARHAEKLLDFEKSAREVAERMTKEEQDRGDRWKKAADEVAPKPTPFYESPLFWFVIGTVAGAAAAIATSFALAPAHSAASK